MRPRRPPVSDTGFGVGRLDAAAAAQYAAESTALDESDFALALGARIDDLEQRVGRSSAARSRGFAARCAGRARS